MAGEKPLALSRRKVATIVVIAVALWSCAFLLWGQVELDKGLLVGLNGLRANALVVGVAQVASRYGMASIVLVYLLYLSVAFKHELRDVYPVYLVVLLLFAVAGIGGDLLKEVFDRPRPFVEYAGEIIAVSKPDSPAFPSGHATKSVALALPFLLLIPARDNRRKGVKVLLAMLAVGVCSSRVVLGVHYVSDVLAGAGMALICLPFVTLLSRRMLRGMSRERLDVRVKVWAVVLIGLMVALVVI